jgi:energy-coupling factor transport system ATP-binding protein
VIRAVDLCFRYPGQPFDALSDIGFDIAAGETVLVSGPTGCGKSTLGLVLCGAIPNLVPGRLSGRVVLNRRPVAERTVREIARDLGFLLQNVEHQTFTERVADEIAFGLENFGMPAAHMDGAIVDALGLVEAGHLLERRLATLSAGERQRVMLAALLVLDQNVLVLDEPLAYLDRRTQQRFMALLDGLSQRGKTVVIFEHRRDAVQPVAHREIYLDAGRIAARPSARTRFPAIGTCRTGTDALVFDGVGFAWPGAADTLFGGISFAVKQGESVVLLGCNGSGKTTLMALAMGLIKPDRGKITTCGHTVGRAAPSKIAGQTAFIFQRPDHQLYLPDVRAEVRSQAGDAGTARAELASMGLRGLEDRHPRSLSMGQKRRLTLAAALARRPQVLLLDEPSVGQDDASLALIIGRLDRFLQEGGALLTATHDARMAQALAHRVLELHGGSFREIRSPGMLSGFGPEPARRCRSSASIEPAG